MNVLLLMAVFGQIPPQLPESSVMIAVHDGGFGSGVLFKNKEQTFVWTDAHVIPKPEIEVLFEPQSKIKEINIMFKDVDIIQPDVENGVTVGSSTYRAKVIKYSETHDLALLWVYKKNYGKSGVVFSSAIPQVGSKTWHVGSMRGPVGINSVSENVVSFVGRKRLFFSPDNNGIIYDQASGVIHEGCSGGGIFLQSNNECIGLVTEFLTAKGGHTHGSFCLTPSRRIIEFAKQYDVECAVNHTKKVPSLDAISSKIYLDKIVVEPSLVDHIKGIWSKLGGPIK